MHIHASPADTAIAVQIGAGGTHAKIIGEGQKQVQTVLHTIYRKG